MAEHVKRVRRRRRVKRVRSGRLQFTPARLAICGASIPLINAFSSVAFGVTWNVTG